ncbi:MAG TPA: alpha/beta fold hydrolase [Rubricoccaceae bacterium]|nr:alpha/beta fold hydrolase [Rubricoccaceae bacterium]
MLSALTRRFEGEPFPQPPLRPTRYPVVLMHGFGALSPLVRGSGMLHPEALHLRMHGVAAYAPQVNPYDTVSVRARAWQERLAVVFEETGAEKVNLVGFSLGGLDARYLAGTLGEAPRIASIVTVATPHRGTPLARYVLDRPERLRSVAVAVMEMAGKAAYEEPPHVLDALAELTPEHVQETFNPAHPMPEGVYCASWAARAGRDTPNAIYPPLVVQNRILYRLGGVNDGFVVTEDARWGEDLGTAEADHARLIGMRVTPSAFDVKAFYLGIAEHLRARGF